MITTSVPAQITSVEDKIAGSLSLLQVILLAMPVCFSTVLIVVFPPNLKIATYKITLAVFVGIISVVLSIRLKDELIILRCLKILSFYRRPSIYLSTISSACNCNDTKIENGQPSDIEEPKLIRQRLTIDPAELAILSDSLEKSGKGFVADKEGNLNAIIGLKA